MRMSLVKPEKKPSGFQWRIRLKVNKKLVLDEGESVGRERRSDLG